MLAAIMRAIASARQLRGQRLVAPGRYGLVESARGGLTVGAFKPEGIAGHRTRPGQGEQAWGTRALAAGCGHSAFGEK